MGEGSQKKTAARDEELEQGKGKLGQPKVVIYPIWAAERESAHNEADEENDMGLGVSLSTCDQVTLPTPCTRLIIFWVVESFKEV